MTPLMCTNELCRLLSWPHHKSRLLAIDRDFIATLGLVPPQDAAEFAIELMRLRKHDSTMAPLRHPKFKGANSPTAHEPGP